MVQACLGAAVGGERYLLEMFYMDDEESGAVMTITAELNIERSTA